MRHATLGLKATAKKDHVYIDVPADKVGAGKHELAIEIQRGSHSRTVKVEVDVPQRAVEYLMVRGCLRAPLDKSETNKSKKKRPAPPLVEITGDAKLWSKHGGICQVHDDSHVYVNVVANSDANVVVQGSKVSLKGLNGTEGQAPISLPLDQIELGSFAKRSRKKFETNVPITLTRPGVSLKGALTMTSDQEDAHSALYQSVLAFEAGKAWKLPRKKSTGTPRAIVMATHTADAKVRGKQRSLRAGVYSRLLTAGDEHHADEIDLFAVAKLTDLKSFGRCTFNMVMGGTGNLSNIRYKHGLQVDVFDHEGKKVAEKSFPPPEKTKCPTSISGQRGETVVLIWGPPVKDVTSFLENVRTGAK